MPKNDDVPEGNPWCSAPCRSRGDKDTLLGVAWGVFWPSVGEAKQGSSSHRPGRWTKAVGLLWEMTLEGRDGQDGCIDQTWTFPGDPASSSCEKTRQNIVCDCIVTEWIVVKGRNRKENWRIHGLNSRSVRDKSVTCFGQWNKVANNAEISSCLKNDKDSLILG